MTCSSWAAFFWKNKVFDIFHSLTLAFDSYMSNYFISLQWLQIGILGDDNCCLLAILLGPPISQCHSDYHNHSSPYTHLAAVEFEARMWTLLTKIALQPLTSSQSSEPDCWLFIPMLHGPIYGGVSEHSGWQTKYSLRRPNAKHNFTLTFR